MSGMTPERLAEIRAEDARYSEHPYGEEILESWRDGLTRHQMSGERAILDRRDLLAEVDARAVTIISLATQLDQALAQAEALVELFTYETLGEPGRIYSRFKGDVDVTGEVATALASEEES